MLKTFMYFVILCCNIVILQLHEFYVLLFVRKCMHHKILPSIFDNYYTLNSHIHRYSTMETDNLHVISTIMVSDVYSIKDQYYGTIYRIF